MPSGRNHKFLSSYRGFVSKDWASYYFLYDHFKERYKQLKGRGDVDLERFDSALLQEIQRVHRFIMVVVESMNVDLLCVSDMITTNTESDEDVDRNIEIALRALFEKSRQMEEFFDLNFFAVSKVIKKMEKFLLVAMAPDDLEEKSLGLKPWHSSPRHLWGSYESGVFFYYEFRASKSILENLTRRCVDLYSSKYRPHHAELAVFELKYVKNKDRAFKSTRLTIGIKLGLICMLLLWVVVDSSTTENTLDFWRQPGLYVYTTIGNFLLYRLGWAFQVYVWSKYSVNYISTLQLYILRPNLILVVNETTSLLLIFCANLLLFFKANSSGSALSNTFLSYACPFVLIVAFVVYQVYDTFSVWANQRLSRGVFTQQVLLRCFQAPFVPVTFRDVFAADILTSFTRVIADSLYASCWVFSGSFSKSNGTENTSTDFGGPLLECTNTNMSVVVSVTQLVPLLIRTLQCLRSCRDGGWHLYPQGYNAIKYVLSMAVVVAALGATASNFPAQVVLVVATTLYKWWWDVVMDWGLGEGLPGSFSALLRFDSYAQTKTWLRSMIMYPWVSAYYLAIALDLVLRFTWVVSLLPVGDFFFVGYQLMFFLGSLEIIRRVMWGCLRIEWEHVKLLRKGTPGYLSTPVIRAFTAATDNQSGTDDLTTSPKVAQSVMDRISATNVSRVTVVNIAGVTNLPVDGSDDDDSEVDESGSGKRAPPTNPLHAE